MMFTDKSSSTSVPKKMPKKKKTRPQGLPSPALCCACGLCIMLAGINITLVGAFAFGTFLPRRNPPIIIGPVLLLVAFAFLGPAAYAAAAPAQGSRKAKGGGNLGLVRTGGTAFEIETSEHTLQDTTAVQLSPTNSPSSSRRSSPSYEANATGRTCKLFTLEANGPASACYSASLAGEAVQLNLPRDPAAT